MSPRPQLRPRPVVTLGQTAPERRRDMRKPLHAKATLFVIDGALANTQHEIMTRDMSFAGVSFLLKDELHVGQTVRLVSENGKTHMCEVIRSRPLSNGKHEMAVKFRDHA